MQEGIGEVGGWGEIVAVSALVGLWNDIGTMYTAGKNSSREHILLFAVC